MSQITAIPPVGPELHLSANGAASSSARESLKNETAAEQPAPAAGAKVPARSDSVSISQVVEVNGHSMWPVVSYTDGDYVASEPGPPAVSAHGSSPGAAADRLAVAVDLVG